MTARPTIRLLPTPTLRVDVAGAGPVGLAFALWLRALRSDVRVRLFDPRLAAGERWSFAGARRRQIVTLQSKQWSALPEPARSALFRDFSEVWPTGLDSPSHLGRPRNVPIAQIEDALLEVVQRDPGVALHAQPYPSSDECDLLAICEGAHSRTRERLIERFGRASPYTHDGLPFSETVLSIEVESALEPHELVLLTLVQNRFLLNTHRGRGFLNMRLTPEEARMGSTLLAPRLRDGLTLFAANPTHAYHTFRVELVHRPRFTCELPGGAQAALLGDAANALHLWPGRGLNSGLKSALSLARCLARCPDRVRAVDLVPHEGLMHMLQARELSVRAQETMRMCDRDGVPRPFAQRVERALCAPSERAGAMRELRARVQRWREHLGSRMPMPLVDMAPRFEPLSTSTLAVLVETGSWNSERVGGHEVDVDALFPPAPRSTLRMWSA
jgi:2-polyprenyl-6-methoxyphenol hydroxylase-like FAD-dependent oxidoreductase